MIKEKQKLVGNLSTKGSLSGSLSNSVIYADPITQEKEVAPTREIQEVTPDTGYTGLSKVKVNGYIPNTANKTVISNGTYKAEDENLDGYDIVKVTCGKYVPRVISFYNYKGTDLNQELANLDTSNMTSMDYMFYGCHNIKALDVSNFNTSNVTSMMMSFQNCRSLEKIDLNSFDVSKVTNMAGMFRGCSKVTEIKLDNFDTLEVKDMSVLFASCNSLITLDLSNFDTNNVKDMSGMFQSCYKLKNIDLSNFDTSSVTSISSMFDTCESLTDLDLSNFNISQVKSLNSMFNACKSLINLNLSNFDTSEVTNVYQMFRFCSKLTEISALDFSSVTNINNIFYGSTLIEILGGFMNLGKGYLTSSSANYYSYKLDLSPCTKLTEQSIINVLNNLYDIKTNGCKSQQVVLGTTNLAKLTSEDGQTALSNAQSKGWTIS